MAETKVPILANGLTLPERVMLGSMTNHVGFPVLVKLMEALCDARMQDVARVDPEKDNYERLLAYRQQRSRITSENCRDILDSIQYHKAVASRNSEEELLLDAQLKLQENE